MWPLKRTDKKTKPKKTKPQKRGAAQSQSLKRRRLFSLFLRRVTLLSLAVALIGGIYIWQTGLFGQWLSQGGQKIDQQLVVAGFVLDHIEVKGHKQTPQEYIAAALEVEKGQSIAAFDLKDMRHRLEAMPWIKTATLSRILPNILAVEITEHEARGLWQENSRLWLIDRQGNKITDKNIENFAHLPQVVGAGAGKELSALLDMQKLYPVLSERIKSSVWVGGRRWDLHFKDGVIIKMPEKEMALAWQRLSEYESRHKILSREILVVDLRLHGKTVLRLTPEEIKARKMLKSLSDKQADEKTI